MFEAIVVPLDGSELPEAVLPAVTELAAKLSAKVLLVQAVDSLAQRMITPPDLLEAPGPAAATIQAIEEAIAAEKHLAQTYLAGVRDLLAAGGVNVDLFVAEGSASDVITSLATDQHAGMIAMSTHGRGGLGRLVFGSVADSVLRHSTVPVLLLRSTDKDR